VTEVENMEKQLLQLETFWELSSFITASIGTDPESLEVGVRSDLYTLALKNPQVKAHLQGLIDAVRGSAAHRPTLDILLTKE